MSTLFGIQNCGGDVQCCSSNLPCDITITYDDINLCEDDNFNLYSYPISSRTGLPVKTLVGNINGIESPPGCCGTIPGTSDPCPENTVVLPYTLVTTNITSCCTVRFTLEFVSANCCGSYFNLEIAGPAGVLYSETQSGGGFDQTFSVSDLCDPSP